MEQVKPANVVQVEPPNVEEAVPLDHFSILINEMFVKLMAYLELSEQLTLRLVCRRLNAKVEGFFETIMCLKLNIKAARTFELEQQLQAPRSVQPWQPNASLRKMLFEFVSKERTTSRGKQMHISISERALNTDITETLCRFFSRIQTLIIFLDTDDTDENIDSLVEMMSVMCSELTAFGLVVSGKLRNDASLNRICSAINQRPLEQLHLMVPEWCVHDQVLAGHQALELDRSIESVINFSMTGMCHTLLDLLLNTNRNLDTLSIEAVMLEAGINDKYAFVKQLQLVNISTDQLPLVEQWFEWFPSVEQLHLNFERQSEQQQTHRTAWIRSLKRLTKLTELTLYNFGLDFVTQKIALGTAADIERLDQVRKLTIASPDLFYHFRTIYSEPFLPGLRATHIAHTIGRQFPGLRELNLWSGDSDLHENVNQTWQTIEQNINVQLPRLLPLLPGLRVNVQLRHPVMYRQYHSRYPALRQQFKTTLSNYNFELSHQSKCMINYDCNVARQYGTDLCAFVKGNFEQLDSSKVRTLMQYYDQFREQTPGAHMNFLNLDIVEVEDQEDEDGLDDGDEEDEEDYDDEEDKRDFDDNFDTELRKVLEFVDE